MTTDTIKNRTFWLGKIENEWQRSILWLSGVRRTGKTLLCRSFSDADYYDCELPAVRRTMEDPESFLKGHRRRRIVLDEIHRLADPSELLKIAADHYPDIRIIATGSSTLGRRRGSGHARRQEIGSLADADDGKRSGGFRQYRPATSSAPRGVAAILSGENPSERWFQEWIDAYWAKDIQELFRLERRHAFQRFVELLMTQSGGIFEATRSPGPAR
jgi:predicted AAA+ superfamily ATPase